MGVTGKSKRWITQARPWMSISERFWRRVDKGLVSECWLWKGHCDKRGYGQIWLPEGRLDRPYRVSHELNIGPIPEGFDIDHLCRNPRCVNPAHLEAVPRVENTMRGFLPALMRLRSAARTACKKGHALDGENCYVDSKGRKRCRKCARDHKKKFETAGTVKREGMRKCSVTGHKALTWGST